MGCERRAWPGETGTIAWECWMAKRLRSRVHRRGCPRLQGLADWWPLGWRQREPGFLPGKGVTSEPTGRTWPLFSSQ